MKEKKKINFDNFVQSNNVIYKLMHTVKKRDENILFVFIIKVSFDATEATLNNDENMQMKKSTENNDIIESMKNDDIVLLTKNSDTVKLINYDDFMNMTSKFFAHMTTDQLDLTELINSLKFFTFALINSFNFSSFMKNKFKLNDN